ncbi:hypothetical protein K469DRAFT_599362 [Zopfia rhizophila CBS 207.26]|uniref:HMA domain-containing protein n=1 Tax=Zopfia rhizophila CBS 207.26 TaxID=1314779 RepID=A0A6A6DG69_9PEZI|nr:hypothetical protein K469DRAFT_599362 [Zopfia rhizophila CBS 207.26]
MALTYKYHVKMSCGGCASSVRKAIVPIAGVRSIDIDLETQTVSAVVEDGVPLNAISQAITAAGKEVKSEQVVDSPEQAIQGPNEELSMSCCAGKT